MGTVTATAPDRISAVRGGSGHAASSQTSKPGSLYEFTSRGDLPRFGPVFAANVRRGARQSDARLPALVLARISAEQIVKKPAVAGPAARSVDDIAKLRLILDKSKGY